MNTFDVNGLPGKDNFPPVDPPPPRPRRRPDGRSLQPLTSREHACHPPTAPARRHTGW